MNQTTIIGLLRATLLLALLWCSGNAFAAVTITQVNGSQYLLDWPDYTSSCNPKYKVTTVINGAVTDESPVSVSQKTVTLPAPQSYGQSITYQVRYGSCSVSSSSYIWVGNANISVPPSTGVMVPPSPSIATIPSEDLNSTKVGILGGQFRVDENGSATYFLPLKLPSAPGNVKPEVSINYSSGAGNGIMGVGWNIGGLSRVYRCRQTQESFQENVPISLTTNDRFCLDGQPLVLVSGSYGAVNSQYVTEIYLGIRVTARGGSSGNPSYFEVEKEDGSVWTYGASASANLLSSTNKTISWGLTQIKDNVSNAIDYTYAKGGGTGYGTNEILIDEISYGGNRIKFNYNEDGNRGDTYTRYVHGSKVESKAILTSIVVWNHNYIPLLSYHFDYQRQTYQSSSDNSQLVEIRQCDGSITNGVCTQPDTFTYSAPGYSIDTYSYGPDLTNVNLLTSFPLDYDGDGYSDWIYAYKSGSNGYVIKVLRNLSGQSAYTAFTETKSISVTYTGITGDNFRLIPMDHDEDGIVDLLGPRTVSGQTTWTAFEYNGQISTTSVPYNKDAAITDANGDGRPDIVSGKTLYINNNLGFSANTIGYGDLVNHLSSTGSSLNNIQTENSTSVDFNGDGSAEFYIKATAFEPYPINGPKDYYFLASIEKSGSSYQFKWLKTTEQHDKAVYADINGDGLTDYIRHINNEWQYALSTGVGMTAFQDIPIYEIDDADTIDFFDSDGDGNLELGFLDKSASKYSTYKYSDGDWSAEFYLTVPGAFSASTAQVGMADFDGDGRADLFAMDYGSNTRFSYKLSYDASANSSLPVDKITVFENGFGAKTNVRYLSMLEDDGESFGPVYTKSSNIPTNYGNDSQVFNVLAPIHLVREVSSDSPGYSGNSYLVDNQVSVQYRYENLRMQAGGRGSLGFEKLATKDMQTEVETITTYSQQFPFIGMPKETTVLLNNVVINHSTNYLQSKNMKYVGAVQNGRAVFPYIQIAEEESFVIEYYSLFPLATPLSTSRTGSTYKSMPSTSNTLYFVLEDLDVITVDPQGNVLKRVETSNQFNAENVSNWWINRITQSQVTHKKTGNLNDVVRQSSFTYNSNGMLETESVGTNNNNTVNKHHYYNNLGMKSKTVTCSRHFGTMCNSLIPSESMLSQDLDKFYRVSELEYNSASRYVALSREGLNSSNIMSETTAVNNWNQPTNAKLYKGENRFGSLTQDIRYDRFGTKYFERDNTGKSLRTWVRTYAEHSHLNTPTINETYAFVTKSQASGASPVFDYFDKVGRSVATVKQGFDGSWIYQYTRYDVDGRVFKTSAPSYSSSGYGWSTASYDALGRLTFSTDANGTTTSVSFEAHSEGQSTQTTVTYQVPGLSNKSIVKYEIHNRIGEMVIVDDNNQSGLETGSGTLRYEYNPAGDLLSVQNVDNFETTSMTYDDYGRKMTSTDISSGTWEYTYNGLGELISQEPSSGNKKFIYRDSMGRKIKEINKNVNDNELDRIEYEYVIGSTDYFSLQKETLKVSGNVDYLKMYDYDQFNRLNWIKSKVGSQYYVQQSTFDQYGRVFQNFDPQVSTNSNRDGNGCFNSSYAEVGTCIGIQNHYNTYGYLYKQSEAEKGLSATGNQMYQEILALDAFGNVTDSKTGQHITIDNVFNANTGLIVQNIVKSGGTVIQFNEYSFDGIGTLRDRERLGLLSSSSDNFQLFTYDHLNRLTHIKNGNTGTNVEHVRYHANGSIAWKRGVDNGSSKYYCYTTTNPYAVSGFGTSNNCTNNSFLYDSTGNMKSGKGRTLTYSHFGKATRITKGSDDTFFDYDSNRARYKRKDEEGSLTTTTYYVGNLEVIYKSDTSIVQTRRSIPGGVINYYSNNSVKYSFIHSDHIGSANTMTDENGKVTSKLAFDPWGKRKLVPYNEWAPGAQGKAAPSLANLSGVLAISTRGFTGHEHINQMDIIHMNGRIYDPTLGRFLQADPHIQAPSNSQSYNRYSYVLNNPLSYTDPSGFFFKWLNKKLGKLAPFASLLALAFIPGAWAFATESLFGAVTTGFLAGGASTGSLKGALVGAFSAAAFYGVGQHFKGLAAGNSADAVTHSFGGLDLTSGQIAGQIASHASVGGVTSVLSGGKFGHGFFSAGVTKGIGGAFLPGGDNLTSNEIARGTVVSAVIGGTTSVISGGKFANGAQTGAFQFLFNQATTKARNALNELIEEKGLRKADMINAVAYLKTKMEPEEFVKLFPQFEGKYDAIISLEMNTLHQALSTSVALDESLKLGLSYGNAVRKSWYGNIKAYLGLTSEVATNNATPQEIIKTYGDAYYAPPK